MGLGQAWYSNMLPSMCVFVAVAERSEIKRSEIKRSEIKRSEVTTKFLTPLTTGLGSSGGSPPTIFY